MKKILHLWCNTHSFLPFCCLLAFLNGFQLSVHAKEWQIRVLYWSMNIPGQTVMRKGLETEAENINKRAITDGKPTILLVPRVAGDGEAGIENQIRQMKELLASRIDLIIVQPTDNAALAEPLRAANKANFPVAAYAQYISGGNFAAYRTSDNYMAGYLDGEYITSLFADDKTLRIVLVEYPHVSSTVEHINGFLDGLAQSKQPYKVLKSYSAVEPISGSNAAQDILRDFPASGSIDAGFTVNDGTGLNVAEAERKEIKIATIDGDPASVENIKNLRLTVIDSAQFCGPPGAETLKIAYAVLSGKKTTLSCVASCFSL